MLFRGNGSPFTDLNTSSTHGWMGPEPSTPVSSHPELESVACGIPSVVKESIELSLFPLFRCAGHFWPSDQSWPARAREQGQPPFTGSRFAPLVGSSRMPCSHKLPRICVSVFVCTVTGGLLGCTFKTRHSTNSSGALSSHLLSPNLHPCVPVSSRIMAGSRPAYVVPWCFEVLFEIAFWGWAHLLRFASHLSVVCLASCRALLRLLQRFHRRCIRIMCRVTRHHTRKHSISTEELEAKLGIHDIRHYAYSRALRYLGHVFRMDADRTPSLLQRCWVVDGKQPSGKIKVLQSLRFRCTEAA